MKNHILILFLIAFTSCKSQSVNIKNWNGNYVANTYYEDIDNELNQFEGTYQFTNGNNELTFTFKKQLKYYNTSYYQDLLTGEYKYKEGGVILVDNLNRINQNLLNKYSHDICGNTLIYNDMKPNCDNCLPNQLRADLIFFGRSNNDNGGSIVIQKFNENGQEKIKIIIFYLARIINPGDAMPLDPKLPSGEYTLTRIY